MDERRSAEHSDRRQDPRGGRRMTDKLACPKCGCLQSVVLPKASQTIEEQMAGGWWRRRRCGNCNKVFGTQEIVREP